MARRRGRDGRAGESFSLRDQAFELLRNGAPEQATFNLDYSPILDDVGRPAGLLAIIAETTVFTRAQDITDQKQAEAALEAHDTLERRVTERTAQLATAVEELRANEARLALLLKQMPAALWTTDADLRATTLTGALVHTLPPALRASVGQTSAEALAIGDPDAPPVAAHRQAFAGVPASFELEVEGHTYMAHVEPLRDAEGHDRRGARRDRPRVTTLAGRVPGPGQPRTAHPTHPHDGLSGAGP